MADMYEEIVDSFVNLLECKDDIRCIILDGSVNNREHVKGLSDIDVKLFVKGDFITQRICDAIQKAIQDALFGRDIIFNAWTLLDAEYPRDDRNSVFDFVRKYCLLRGTVLYSNHFTVGSIGLVSIGENERLSCLKAVFNFQIRLRRLLTNPVAITDVNNPTSDFLLQQSVAYLFHALRYYNAYYGKVCCKIKDVLAAYKTLSDQDISFLEKMYSLRCNWDNRPKDLLLGRTILCQTTAFIDSLSARMRADFNNNNNIIPITYI